MSELLFAFLLKTIQGRQQQIIRILLMHINKQRVQKTNEEQQFFNSSATNVVPTVRRHVYLFILFSCHFYCFYRFSAFSHSVGRDVGDF